MVASEVFPMKPKHRLVYPNKENAFMPPNHVKKGDYYVNLCLPYLIDKLWFIKMAESEVFLMKWKHQFIYPNE